MKPSLAAIVVLVMVLVTPLACADTGQLREVVSGDGMRAIVFTSPTPLRAGLVEVAVAATEAENGAPLDQFELDVEVRGSDWAADVPSMVIGGGPDPSDGFIQKAVLDVPSEGSWELVVEVRSEGRVLRIPVLVSVGAPLPAWWQILPIAMSGAPFLLLVVVRDHLARRREIAGLGDGRDRIDARP